MLGQRYLYDGKPFLYLNQQQIESVERIKSAGYSFEDFPCECGATEEAFDVLSEKDRYGFASRTVICRKCGLVMTNPRMTQVAYDDFYNKEYGRLYRNLDVPDDAFFEKYVKYGKGIYNFIVNTYGKTFRSVLEIGCAGGSILYYFREKGCEVTGIDLGGDYIAYGQSKGLNLRQCHSFELIKENKKYDLIILSQVMEHFLTIDTELNTIRQLLAEDGILYIEVPGITSLVNNYRNDFGLYLQNAHVYCFTLGTLESVMNKYGFSLVEGNEVVRSIWKYTGNKKDITNNYFCEIMSFLYRLEHYRESREKISVKLTSLAQLNVQLVYNMKLLREKLIKREHMISDTLDQILRGIEEGLQIIPDVAGFLNREKENLNVTKIDEYIMMLNDALDEADIDKIENAIDLMIPTFENLGDVLKAELED